MKFAELHLHPLLEAAIEKSKFTECTPVQAATIPHVLEAKDVAGLAQTGTGKTAAFLLPLMDRVLRSQEAGLEKGSWRQLGSKMNIANENVRVGGSEDRCIF